MGTLSDGLIIQSKIPGFMPNLFEVSIFGEDTVSPTDENKKAFTESYTGEVEPTRFYCSSYDLPAPSLTAKRNPYDKTFYISKYSIPETISITWQENANMDVWRYHQSWLRCFYNRETDQYVVGSSGKKRNAYITIQQYAGFQDASLKSPAFSPELNEVITINLKGLIPLSVPPLHGDWNQDASSATSLAIKYTVDYVAITSEKTFIGAQ